jgi:hypothetical protein
MNKEFDFLKTTMHDSRKADFHLGCLVGSVFIDFNLTSEKLIRLCRISFDGYGCCNLDNNSKSLNEKLSQSFINEIDKINFDQEKMTKIVLILIGMNKDYIWTDALEEYNLIDKKI